MAKAKKAKKATKTKKTKKTTRATRAPGKNVIVYSCDPKCKPDIHDLKLKRNSFVYLVADGTNVTLNFLTSPFNPPMPTVSIPTNTFVKLKIGMTTGTFTYTVSCTGCPSPMDDPSMIVDL